MRCRPIEACVILLPLFEFLHGSPTFCRVFASTLYAQYSEKKTATRITPLPLTLISTSSYLFSHASSTSSPRAIAYASLALCILLVLVENDDTIAALRQDNNEDVRLCRQVCTVDSWRSRSIQVDLRSSRGNHRYPLSRHLDHHSVHYWTVAYYGYGTIYT